MTFLPIVEHELRVVARRPATHWTRSCAALATLTIWLLLALSTPQSVPVPQLSKNLFIAIALLAKRRLQRRFREIASGPLSKELKAQRAGATRAMSFGHRPVNATQRATLARRWEEAS